MPPRPVPDRFPWLRTVTFAACVLSALVMSRHSAAQGKRWFKGNLHTHSFWSDGDEYPEMIMDWYKTHGYDFVALSDHNILAEGDKWIRVPKSRMYAQGFENYLARFGSDWVDHRTDSGRLQVRLKTYDEYRKLFEDESFLIIRSEEITDHFEGRPVHINATNIARLISPQGGGSVSGVMQRNIDAVLEQRKDTGIPMFPHINHPNFGYAITIDDMIALRGERFFEVYNGHPLVNNYGDSLRPGTEQMWDIVNIAYRERQQPLLFALATDDSHNYHQLGTAYSNAGRGWVMVRADSLGAAALITAMEAGDFYASTGVALSGYSFEDSSISVEVDGEKGISYTIEFIGVLKGERKARVLKTVSGTRGDFELTDAYLFVRAKIVSDKPQRNPFREGDFETAWTQPVFQR